MINYIEKHGIHKALKIAGLYIKDKGDRWVSNQNHDVINQFIIGFDEVAALRAELKSQLVKDSQEYVDNIILSKYPTTSS